VFEAISNSVHAIQAAGRSDGLIVVELTRDATQGRLPLSAESGEQPERSGAEIVEIRITDNGIGFTEQNFESFLELDTRHKARIGGKGIGRLVWLRVFERIRVASTYRAGVGARRRQFDFVLPEGITNLDESDVPDEEAGVPSTTITMSGAREPFRNALRYRGATIRSEIVKHFLSYLLSSNAPRIEVVDGDDVLAVSIDDITGTTRAEFTLRDYTFTINHLKIRSPTDRSHMVYYCADSRVVRSEQLKALPPGRFQDDTDEFYYNAYISSEYLDSNVNEQRTGFAIEEEPDMLPEVSYSDLRAEVQRAASEFLELYLSDLARERDARIARVLDDRFPELRYVREQNRDELTHIPMGATDREVEEEIAKIHFRNQRTGKDLLASAIAEMQTSATIDFPSFSQKFERRFEELNKVNQAGLLSYLLFRRGIIEIYEQVLKKSGDRFQREAAVHRLMFPMGTDHDPGRAYLDHNLWLIDERLTYASYIASDLPLKKHKVLFGVADRGEPDLAIYFNLGFSPEDPAEGPLQNVVIVEFKRPGPLASRRENPWEQVMRYIEEIRAGLYTDSGQKVRATDATRFYCYIVCDVDDQEVQRLRTRYQFKPLFDGFEGYFLYNEELKAYVELLPFEKILRDAKRNHRAFFERVGLLNGR
jgi:hypothetical protein